MIATRICIESRNVDCRPGWVDKSGLLQYTDPVVINDAMVRELRDLGVVSIKRNRDGSVSIRHRKLWVDVLVCISWMLFGYWFAHEVLNKLFY